MPAHIELARHAGGGAHGLLGPFVGTDASQQRAFGVPDGVDGFFDPVAAHVVFHMLGSAAQRNFAQRDQVALAKEILRGALGLLGQIHLASLEAADQLVGCHVDQNNFIGVVDHRVGHGFMHPHARDGTDRAIQTFQMLHIQRRPHVDAGFEQFQHILPALGMARAGDVAVRQLIDQQDGRLARQGGVQVKLFEAAVPIRHILERQLLQPGQQLGGVAATVGFNHTHQHWSPRLDLPLGCAQHRKRLAHTRTGTEVNAQLAAPRSGFLAAQLLEQLVGVGAG